MKYVRMFARYLTQSLVFAMLNISISTIMGIVVAILLPKLGLNPSMAVNLANQASDPEVMNKLAAMPLWRFALAGFEDVAFVLPAILLAKRNKPLLAGMLIPILSVLFVSGHLYQGLGSALCKLHYVPLAFWYARKFGISRTITGHAIQDMTIMTIVKLGMGKL